MKFKHNSYSILALTVVVIIIINGCAFQQQTKAPETKSPGTEEKSTQTEQTTAKDDFGCFPLSCSDVPDAPGRQMCEDWRAGKSVTWPPDCSYSPTEECKNLCNAEKKDSSAGQPQQQTQQNEQTPEKPAWKLGAIAVAGQYADADIIDLGDGKFRMYYSAEPEVQNFEGQLYSAVSSDGISWSQENGIRKNWATFPSVIKLPDGKYRLYFQNQGVIKSAVSADGLSWSDESGVRVDAGNNAGLKLENVAAPTVIKVDNEYLMVYRGTINERYPAKVPNNNIQLFLWATSGDGLVFEKKGMALDSRNSEFSGLLDGSELVEWDDGSVRLYFWSYKGVYHITYKYGKFSQDAEFDYTTNNNLLNQFPENPPGDPTLLKINGKW